MVKSYAKQMVSHRFQSIFMFVFLICLIGCDGSDMIELPSILCENGVIDDGETSIDCGGPCGACALEDTCIIDDDCQSGRCLDEICSCADGFEGRNGECVNSDECSNGQAECADFIANSASGQPAATWNPNATDDARTNQKASTLTIFEVAK